MLVRLHTLTIASLTLLLAVVTSAWVAPPAVAAGGGLYVDAGSAACSDTGTGDSSTPFCTIYAAAKKATPGDTVHVADGSYPEQVTVPSGVSFVAASPSTVVLGANSLVGATWTPAASGTAYTTPLPLAANPSQVFRSGTALTRAAGPGTTIPGSYYWDFTNKLLYVDIGGAAPTDADNLTISRTYGFLAANTTGVSISGFTVRQQNSSGVSLSGSTGATVSNVTVTDAGAYGVSDSGGSGNRFQSVTSTLNSSIGIRLFNTIGDTVDGGTVIGNGHHGVSAQGGSGAHISHVTATGNKRPGIREAAGIDVSASSLNALVEDNTTYSNDDSGIEIYTGSTGAVVRRNISYDNNDHGIDISQGSGALVISNTVVGNVSSGINVEGGTAGGSVATVRNNIAVDNTRDPSRSHGDIRVDGQSTSGSSIDSDLVFESGGSSYAYEWGGVGYSTRGALLAASGQEGNGIQADPRFTSLSSRNLTLTGSSPAIDAADSGAPGWATRDHVGKQPVDDPQVADTGAGPITYADLGALELTDVPAPTPDAAPTAALTVTPGQVDQGGSVTLDASGSTDDKGITGYVFGCGTGTVLPSQNAATARCTYSSAGSFTASVQVSDGAGQTATATQTVTVTAPPPPPPAGPTAALVVSPPSVVAGGRVTLDASASKAAQGRSIASYAFDCGTGSGSRSQASGTTVCTYPAPGTFRASVVVTDDAARTGSATQTVTVTAPPPPPAGPTAALVVSPPSVVAGGRVTLDASASKAAQGRSIASYAFDCGTGSGSRSQASGTTVCTYPAPGTFRASVVVTDDAARTGSATQTVTVTAAPSPAGPSAALRTWPKSVRQGERVTLDASASRAASGHRIVSYRFVCGDGGAGTTQARATKVCTYRKVGRFTASVVVVDDRGKRAAKTAVVKVTPGPLPTARLKVSPTHPHRGHVVWVSAAASTGSSVSRVVAYRFQCGWQARTAWRKTPTASCRFWAAPGSTQRVSVWVKNSLGLVKFTYKKVHVVR